MKSAAVETKRVMPVATGQTGPRTSYGKARSSLNARKHGIYSKSPNSLATADEQATYRAALAGLKAEHPYATGQLGTLLLTQLAMLAIRQGRMWQLEADTFDALERGRSPERLAALEQVRKYSVSLSKETDQILGRIQGLRTRQLEGEQAEVQSRKLKKFHSAKD